MTEIGHNYFMRPRKSLKAQGLFALEDSFLVHEIQISRNMTNIIRRIIYKSSTILPLHVQSQKCFLHLRNWHLAQTTCLDWALEVSGAATTKAGGTFPCKSLVVQLGSCFRIQFKQSHLHRSSTKVFFYQIGILEEERILWLLLSGWRRRKQTGVVRLQALRCKDPREVLSWLLDSRLHCIPHHFVRSPQPCWDNCFYSSLVSVLWPEAALLAVED